MADWKKVFITPQKFHDDIIELCNLIPKGKYKSVIGLPRGGCIAAVYISHFCNLKYFKFEDFQYMDDFSEVLVIDDLVDTGKTLKDLQEGEEHFDTGVVYYKPRSVVVPTYYVEEFKNSDWIVFPFEKADEEPNRET